MRLTLGFGTRDANRATKSTGQIETENDWVLPENYTQYSMGDNNDLVLEFKQEVTLRSRTGSLPTEVISSSWDPETETWSPAEKVEYGYRIDNEGTAYRILSLYYVRNLENGNWEKNFAVINRFNTTPYQNNQLQEDVVF